MAKFSMWAGEESGGTLKRGHDKPTLPGDHDAVLVKAFEASSWNEACQVQYDHYGWGIYTPHDEWEVIGADEE
jgi:hypothetical protein